MRPVRIAVIPAAGRGKRFEPVSKAVPKVLLPVGTRPMIDFAVEEAFASGIEKIIVVLPTHPTHREAIIAHFASARHPAVFAFQHEAAGLGDAILRAEVHTHGEPFAVLLPDELYEPPYPTSDLLFGRELSPAGSSLLSLREVPETEVSRYGIAACAPEPDETALRKVVSLVEKPLLADAPSRIAVMGRYVLDPAVFAVLRETPMGRGGEVQLTDALATLAAHGLVRGRSIRGRRYDVGTPAAWLETNREIGRKHIGGAV